MLLRYQLKLTIAIPVCPHDVVNPTNSHTSYPAAHENVECLYRVVGSLVQIHSSGYKQALPVLQCLKIFNA